jgi:hypothetical protein
MPVFYAAALGGSLNQRAFFFGTPIAWLYVELAARVPVSSRECLVRELPLEVQPPVHGGIKARETSVAALGRQLRSICQFAVIKPMRNWKC